MNTIRSGIQPALEASHSTWNLVMSFVAWGSLAGFAFASLYHFLRYASLPVQ